MNWNLVCEPPWIIGMIEITSPVFSLVNLPFIMEESTPFTATMRLLISKSGVLLGFVLMR